MESELHVVFGAGQIGSPLAALLVKSGKRVRVAKRSATGVPPGAELMAGDAANAAFCVEAAAGAATIYHCMNPPYSRELWARFVPLYMENLIVAASRAGARLVVLDNIYQFGRLRGRALDETTPRHPSSRKGAIRARASERLFEAHQRGEVRALAAHASDYYGPGGTLTYFGNYFWPAVFQGKKVQLPMRIDTPHTYHYIPDVAAALATLGSAGPDAYGHPWMLPCAPAETTRAHIDRLSRELGREIRAATVPRWLLRLTALFEPFMRELAEMAYQWDEPFVIDDRRFRAQFGVGATSLEDGAKETVRWARAHYGDRERRAEALKAIEGAAAKR